MGSKSWAGVLLPARFSLCFHSLCLPFPLTAQQSPHRADVLTTVSIEQPGCSCSELISTKHGATFLPVGYGCIESRGTLSAVRQRLPEENSLAIWRTMSSNVGSSGSSDNAGLLRIATQLPLLDNFITLELFRAKNILASLSSGASDSLFRPKTSLLISVSLLYRRAFKWDKACPCVLLNPFSSTCSCMWFASEIQSQYRPLANEYPVILIHLCLATNNACISNSGLHQFAGSSAGPLPARGNGTTFRFSGITNNCSEIPGSKKRQNSGEPKDYRRSALPYSLLNLSSGDQIKGRGTITSCLGCVRNVM